MNEAGGSFTINGVRVDRAAQRLSDSAGNVRPLRPRSFSVLCHLADNADRVVGKEELMEMVWPGLAVTDDSLVQCIGDIRRALGDHEQKLLRTVPRRGYQLILPPPASPAASPAKPRRRPLWLAAALIAMAFVATAVAGVAWRVTPARDGPPAVAVLPFDDMSPGGGQTYLGDGVADEITTMLARSPVLSVVARNSAFKYRGHPVDVREVGRDLDVAYVLEGSVRRAGDALRITAQLVDARTGRHVWADRFDRAGSDPSALSDEVVTEIAATLAGDKGAVRHAEFAAAWGKDSASLGEYDYAMRALDLMWGDNSAAGNVRADAVIREGLARYPDSAHLKMKLAWNDWRRAYNFWSTDAKAMRADFESAGRLIREVLATPNLAPAVARAAHSLLGYVLMREGDYAGVRREAGIVEAMGPNDPWQLTDLAETLVPAGDYDRARRFIALGMKLNPADADYQHGLLAWTLRLQGDLEGSARESAAAGFLFPYQHLQYAITLMRLGREPEGRAEVAKALADDPDFTLRDWRDATFYADPALAPREVEDLRRAGLPEDEVVGVDSPDGG